MNNELVPFGKYKGQSIDVMANDHEYVSWLSAQPWFRERFVNIYNTIINNFNTEQSTDTPEHNKLQALFLKNTFCANVIDKAYLSEFWEVLRDARGITKENVKSGDHVIFLEKSFEVSGADVHIDLYHTYKYVYHKFDDCDNGEEIRTNKITSFRVEIKPSVADEYPSVLRQMKKNHCDILFLENYSGMVSETDFIEIFRLSNIKIVFLRDMI